MQPQTPALIRYLGDVFLAFVAIMLIVGLGSILGLVLSATGPQMLLPAFLGPTYLFFILVGAGLGYVINRRHVRELPHGCGFCPRFGLCIWVHVTLAAAYTKGTVCWATSGTL